MSFLPARARVGNAHGADAGGVQRAPQTRVVSTQWPRAAVILMFSMPLIATLSGITRFCHSRTDIAGATALSNEPTDLD